MPTATAIMTDPETPEPLDASSQAWLQCEPLDVSENLEARFIHSSTSLYLKVEGLQEDQCLEIVLDVPGRGKWPIWLGGPEDSDVKLPENALLLPEYSAGFHDRGLVLSVKHLHLAPQGVLATTPTDGEEWGLALRVYPRGNSVPVSWLDEGSKLRFQNSWKHRPIHLKDEEPVTWGIGMNLVRLNLGDKIPEGTVVQVEPEELFIPKRSKDISYVKGRIARGGEFRVVVTVPPPPSETSGEEESEESGEEDQAAIPKSPFCGCLSFFVPSVWNRLEKMESHVEERLEETQEPPDEQTSRAVENFRNSLLEAEKYRTAQAKSVIKQSVLEAVDNAFFDALAAMRTAAGGRSMQGLYNPYSGTEDYHKGILCLAHTDDQAAKAVDRARSLGCDFLLLALAGGATSPEPEDFPVIRGRVIGHFNRVVEFTGGKAPFRALLDPSGPPQALPPHLSRVRAVGGEVPCWHEALASGIRLSYVAPDTGEGGPEGVPFIHVASPLNPVDVISAMANGASYVRVHPSPEIAELKTEGAALKVRREESGNVSQIVFIGRDGPLGLSPTTEAEYTFKGSEQFVRVQMLAGAAKVGEKQVSLTTILNPVYLADWVNPWLEELVEKGSDEETGQE